MRTFSWPVKAARLLAVGTCFLPALLSAHPGHYHPDETDEFDSIRAMFFHSHGALDYVLVTVALMSVGVVCINGRRDVRIGAMVVALGSIAMLPIL